MTGVGPYRHPTFTAWPGVSRGPKQSLFVGEGARILVLGWLYLDPPVGVPCLEAERPVVWGSPARTLRQEGPGRSVQVS